MDRKLGTEHRPVLLVIAAQLLALIAVAAFIKAHDAATGTARLEGAQVAVGR
jgi:hypothetical protein